LLKKIVTIVILVVVIFILYKLAYFVAPFLIAFLLASIIEPPIKLMVKFLKLPRKLAAVISMLLMFFTVGSLLTLLITKLVNEIIIVAGQLPGYYNELTETLISKGTDIYLWLPKGITDNIGSVISNISKALIDLSTSLVKGAFATAFSLPGAVVFIFATILSTYFIASDRDRIIAFIKGQLPAEWIRRISNVKNDLFSGMFGYIRAQLIIMSITFVELFIAFSIMRIKFSFLLALLTSFIDSLPIFGTGTILIPWALYSFITGNIRQGISLLITYIIVLVVRQMIEPKIIGVQIGVYPLLTLASMYIGLKVIGVVGLILGPITVLLVKSIVSGIFKTKESKEGKVVKETKERKEGKSGKDSKTGESRRP